MFATLCSLNPDGDWKTQYKHLDTSSDLQSVRWEPDDDDQDRKVGENKRQLSWIWLVSRDDGDGLNSLETTEEEVNECEYILVIFLLYYFSSTL